MALGGLAAGWGAGIFPFDDADLAGLPINAHELQPHYEEVAERIGVSGEHDDLSAFFGDCRAMLPSLELDSAGEQLLGRYGRKRAKLNAAGFFLGKTRLAACSREHRGRGPHPHLDLDFWSDAERARLVQAQYYSYRSLLSFKLLKESPLAHRDSLHLMRMLQPLLGIIGIHHEDRPTPAKTCVLRRTRARGGDRLELDYRPSSEEEQQQRMDEKVMLKGFRRLGCLPLRRIRPGHGSAIHYAGGLPMSSKGGELTCDVNGLLAGSRSVYIADGAAFGALPAKGLTFTIMANANRVGTQLAEELAQ